MNTNHEDLIGLILYAPIEKMGSAEEVQKIWDREKAKIDRNLSGGAYQNLKQLDTDLARLPQKVIDDAVGHKFRPVLVIGATNNRDVIVLPITSHNRGEYGDSMQWTYLTGEEEHPLITLFKKEKCWIECDHPQTLDKRMLLIENPHQCFDFSALYPEDFYKICQTYRKFSQELQKQQDKTLQQKMNLLENQIKENHSKPELKQPKSELSEPDVPAPESHIRKSRNTMVAIGGQPKVINQQIAKEEEKRSPKERQSSRPAHKPYYPKQDNPKNKRKRKQQRKSQLS